MSTDTGSDITGNDKRMARTTAIGLGVWLAITVAAVVVLLLLGDAISSLFI